MATLGGVGRFSLSLYNTTLCSGFLGLLGPVPGWEVVYSEREERYTPKKGGLLSAHP